VGNVTTRRGDGPNFYRPRLGLRKPKRKRPLATLPRSSDSPPTSHDSFQRLRRLARATRGPRSHGDDARVRRRDTCARTAEFGAKRDPERWPGGACRHACRPSRMVGARVAAGPQWVARCVSGDTTVCPRARGLRRVQGGCEARGTCARFTRMRGPRRKCRHDFPRRWQLVRG
jgi:hypothetical protein